MFQIKKNSTIISNVCVHKQLESFYRKLFSLHFLILESFCYIDLALASEWWKNNHPISWIFNLSAFLYFLKENKIVNVLIGGSRDIPKALNCMLPLLHYIKFKYSNAINSSVTLFIWLKREFNCPRLRTFSMCTVTITPSTINNFSLKIWIQFQFSMGVTWH